MNTASIWNAFLDRYPPGSGLRRAGPEQLERYRGILPEELLELWQRHGFGCYGGGLLQVIDPEEYAPALAAWLGEQPDCRPILMTGFGLLLIHRRLSPVEDDICLLDIPSRRSGSFSTGFSAFVRELLPSEGFAGAFLRRELFAHAAERLGPPAAGECFFFVPALALGGSESPDRVEKGGALTHQLLLAALGDSEEDGEDDWSRAYEAQPRLFQREDGALEAHFTLTETVDTILPAAPERLYEVEGEQIALWALTLFSLTRDAVLGTLEYHDALRRLQPFVTGRRGDAVLVRGLTREELSALLDR